ncbi:hypothetical protein [Microbacterium lacticum]
MAMRFLSVPAERAQQEIAELGEGVDDRRELRIDRPADRADGQQLPLGILLRRGFG